MMDSHCVGESEGLTFYIARPKDYDDVMAISQDIYEGNDYLPHRYHFWMTEPDRLVFIARRVSKLVALESSLIVDGGETVVVEGLRVCPSERGRGLAGVIQRFVDGYLKKTYPSLKKKRITRQNVPGAENMANFTFLARRAVLSLHGNSESLDDFVTYLMGKLDASDGSNTRHPLVTGQIKQNALMPVLLDPELPSRLQLPGGAIIQDWQPLKIIESNFEILARQNLSWFVDGFIEKPLFVSFHTPPYPVPLNGGSVRLNIDMFGTDVSQAKRALTAHLNTVKGEIKCAVVIHIFMHQSLWEDLRQFCEGHDGVKQWREYWEQLFLERDI
ncbi:N-acetyltransferase 16, like [Misgurnus anguillicaudatus]|uniref:N-acetyltransferase 16, like n=1 Tax=Misgurnus anguillicaudatus TaxID=75329 RepID=UPI003CCF8064